MSKPKTINARIADFLKSYKSGSSAALGITLAVMDHTIQHNDWSPMAKLVMSVDERMRKQMLQIIKTALGGVSGAVDTKAENGYRFKLADNFGPSDKMEALRALVEAKASLFSGDVNEWLGKECKKERVVNVDKRFDAMADLCLDQGLTEDEALDRLAAAIRAHRAKREAEAMKAAD